VTVVSSDRDIDSETVLLIEAAAAPPIAAGGKPMPPPIATPNAYSVLLSVPLENPTLTATEMSPLFEAIFAQYPVTFRTAIFLIFHALQLVVKFALQVSFQVVLALFENFGCTLEMVFSVNKDFKTTWYNDGRSSDILIRIHKVNRQVRASVIPS